MDEKRGDTSHETPDESTLEGRNTEGAMSPQSGTKPTGQAPQGGGGDPLLGDPGQEDREGRGAQPDQGEGGDMESGQVNGLGGPGDRTNLAGLAGPEKTNWSEESERGSNESA